MPTTTPTTSDDHRTYSRGPEVAALCAVHARGRIVRRWSERDAWCGRHTVALVEVGSTLYVADWHFWPAAYAVPAGLDIGADIDRLYRRGDLFNLGALLSHHCEMLLATPEP